MWVVQVVPSCDDFRVSFEIRLFTSLLLARQEIIYLAPLQPRNGLQLRFCDYPWVFSGQMYGHCPWTWKMSGRTVGQPLKMFRTAGQVSYAVWTLSMSICPTSICPKEAIRGPLDRWIASFDMSGQTETSSQFFWTAGQMFYVHSNCPLKTLLPRMFEPLAPRVSGSTWRWYTTVTWLCR